MSDYFLAMSLLCLAATVYYLLFREKKHKEFLAFSRRQLMLYSFDPVKLKEFSNVLNCLSIEERLKLTYDLFGKNRVLFCSFKVFESGIQLCAVWSDDKELDAPSEPRKKFDYVA